MPYYVLECEGDDPIAELAEGPDLPGGPWYDGAKLQIDVPETLEYAIDEDDADCNLKALYDEESVPIMRLDLLNALQSAGVNNLELFDAVVRNPVSGEERHDYKAFNVVGLVAAADMDESKMMGTSSSRMLDADFDQLVIDEEKAQPFLLFRLAESLSAIVVADSVKDEIEKRQIPGLVFYESGEWSG